MTGTEDVILKPPSVAFIDENLCIGCELCVAPCPVDCISMLPLPQEISSRDKKRAAAQAAKERYHLRLERIERDKREKAERLAQKEKAAAKSVAAPNGHGREATTENEIRHARFPHPNPPPESEKLLAGHPGEGARIPSPQSSPANGRSVKGFGTYGDIMIRDRKMYVAPTPFALTDGTTGLMTLIIPEGMESDPRYQEVGRLTRVEADTLVVGYTFDLRTNELKAERVPNPSAGTEHRFVAYRLAGQSAKPVSILGHLPILEESSGADEE